MISDRGFHDRYPPEHSQLWVPSPKWVRAFFNGIAVADSKYAMLWRGRPPVYYFPRVDVRLDLLLPTDTTTHSDLLGGATYWTVQVGNRSAQNAAWTYVAPPDEAPPVKGYIAFDWEAMDAWFEEDEPVRCHPHDPYVHIDVLKSTRTIRAVVDGETVAESRRPVLLFETGQPTRYYLPQTDVHMDWLERTEKVTHCPYKGEATHYTLRLGDTVMENVAWSYPFPDLPCAGIKDLIAFHHTRIDEFYVDGQILPPPPL